MVVIVVVLLLLLLVLLLCLCLCLRLRLCRGHPPRKATHTTVRAPSLGPTIHARSALDATALRHAIRKSLATITGNTTLARRRLPVLGILPATAGRTVASAIPVETAIAAHPAATHSAHTGTTRRVIAAAGATSAAGSAATTTTHASVAIAAAAAAAGTSLQPSGTGATTSASPATRATTPKCHTVTVATLSLRWLLHVGVAITVRRQRLPVREAHAREEAVLASCCCRRSGRRCILPKPVATTAAVPTTVFATITHATGGSAPQVAQVRSHRWLLLLRGRLLLLVESIRRAAAGTYAPTNRHPAADTTAHATANSRLAATDNARCASIYTPHRATRRRTRIAPPSKRGIRVKAWGRNRGGCTPQIRACAARRRRVKRKAARRPIHPAAAKAAQVERTKLKANRVHPYSTGAGTSSS